MKTIEDLLRNLARPEVLEFALASDRLPCVKVGGSFQPVDGAAPSTDAILQMLVGVGGSRHVELLSTKPTQWTTRLDGLGTVSISAIMRNDVVQARFTLTKRELRQSPIPAPPDVNPASGTGTITLTKDTISSIEAAAAPRPDARPEVKSRVVTARVTALLDEPVVASSDDDDEPTLMTQPTAAGPARAKPVALDLEMDDDTSPRPVAAPRPPSHGAPSEEETTNEIELGTTSEGMSVILQTPPPSSGPTQRASATASTSPGVMKDTVRNLQGMMTPDFAKVVAPARKSVPPSPVKEVSAAPLSPPLSPSSPPPPLPPLAPLPAEPVSTKTAPTSVPPAPAPAPAPAPGPPPLTPHVSDREPSVIEHARIIASPGAASTGLVELLALARATEASDLHVVSGRPVLVRIAGELVPRSKIMDAAAVERLGREAIPKRELAAFDSDGACDFMLDHAAHGRFRVNVTRQRTGLKVCFRVIARQIPTLASLGLPESLAASARHHQGLIVLSSPAGHGKTSTLTAMVDVINRETSKHVITIEDPVEHLHPRKKALMSQREVGTHTRSVATALRAALREDPDVIVVGELRDAESVRLALAAADTGHLVLTTMSTPSAFKTIDRLIELFPRAEQPQIRRTIAGALRLIVGQRLVPNVDHTRLEVAAEILPGSMSLYTLLRDTKASQMPSAQPRSKVAGIVRLDDALAELVRSGKATCEDARLFAEAPDDLEGLLGVQPSSPWPEIGKMPEETMDLGGLLSKAGSLFGKKGG